LVITFESVGTGLGKHYKERQNFKNQLEKTMTEQIYIFHVPFIMANQLKDLFKFSVSQQIW
jgi:hypothetical protein